jgi:hypothetical protein
MRYPASARARRRVALLVATGAATLLVAACAMSPAPPLPSPPAVSPELVALQDRAAIESLLADYYAGFGADSGHDCTVWFTPEGVLDMNGLVATGADQIRATSNSVFTSAHGLAYDPALG